VLKLTCQDKDKVSLTLPVLPPGAPTVYTSFFVLQETFVSPLFVPSVGCCCLFLFLIWVFLFLFIFLYPFFNVISGSCWKPIFVLLPLTCFFFPELSCFTSTPFSLHFSLRPSIIFLGKAQMDKGICSFWYLLFPKAKADQQFPAVLQICHWDGLKKRFFSLKSGFFAFLSAHYSKGFHGPLLWNWSPMGEPWQLFLAFP